MKEPINLRLSTCNNPQRGEKFEAILSRRRANATGVIRALVDAYIKSDGKIDFPVKITHDDADPSNSFEPLRREHDAEH